MYCSKCGTDNRENARFCEKCGFALGGQAASQPSPPPFAGQPPAIPLVVDDRMRGAGGSSQVMIDPMGRRYAVGKNPTAAILLSIFLSPFGQLYNGDFKKFFAMLGGYIVGFLATIATGGAGSVIILGIWVWSIIDAYNVASRKSTLW